MILRFQDFIMFFDAYAIFYAGLNFAKYCYIILP